VACALLVGTAILSGSARLLRARLSDPRHFRYVPDISSFSSYDPMPYCPRLQNSMEQALVSGGKKKKGMFLGGMMNRGIPRKIDANKVKLSARWSI